MLSNLVVDFPEIAEIDVNPVVISEGKPIAVDARIIIDQSVLDGKPDSPHLVITPYPTRFVTPWKLADGTEVLLRPIRPEDEPMIDRDARDDERGGAARPLLRRHPRVQPRAARALHQHRLRARDRHDRRADPRQEEAHHRRRPAARRSRARVPASSPSSSTTSSTAAAWASSSSTSSSASPRRRASRRSAGRSRPTTSACSR